MDFNTTLNIALDNFVQLAQALIDAHMTRCFPNLPREVLSLDRGRRYVRVVRDTGTQRFAFCFVDATNGDVLKSASWKAPAKHARGNIFDPNPVAGVGPYGAKYL